MKIPVFTVFLWLFSACTAQHAVSTTDTGKVIVIEDLRVKEMMGKYIEMNEKCRNRIKGYRVQIHFGAEKSRAREMKAKFLMRFSEVPAYELYEQPYFKIRVGDFRTRLDAFRFHKQISPEFPGSFIVEDDIELPRLD
jgi:hypothetical protein